MILYWNFFFNIVLLKFFFICSELLFFLWHCNFVIFYCYFSSSVVNCSLLLTWSKATTTAASYPEFFLWTQTFSYFFSNEHLVFFSFFFKQTFNFFFSNKHLVLKYIKEICERYITQEWREEVWEEGRSFEPEWCSPRRTFPSCTWNGHVNPKDCMDFNTTNVKNPITSNIAATATSDTNTSKTKIRRTDPE